MRLQCLCLTWKCYIVWSPQLDDTQAGRWMYININSLKQRLFGHWCKTHYLITGSTNSFPFSHIYIGYAVLIVPHEHDEKYELTWWCQILMISFIQTSLDLTSDTL